MNIAELNESEQRQAAELYHCHFVHYHYVKNTAEYNKLHHEALSLTSMFLARLFYQASFPWEGETHALKASLIEVREIWGTLTGGEVPCPTVFDPEDLRKTKELGAKLQDAGETFESCRAMVEFETETWVSNERFETAVAINEHLKEKVMAAVTDEVQAGLKANWFLNDMDETNYM